MNRASGGDVATTAASTQDAAAQRTEQVDKPTASRDAAQALQSTRLVATLSADPFETTNLLDPYPMHRAIRDAAPAVWLEHYGIWAMGRHAEVHAALSDWSTYSSAAGVGLSDFRKEKPWRPPSLLLEADPPEHTRARAVVTGVLSRAALNGLRDGFRQRAVEVVEAALARRDIDAIGALAHAFPLAVFPDAVGLPREGRDNLLPYGNMAFNAFGPRNELLAAAMKDAAPATDWIMAQCRREALAPGGLGARIFAAADAGQVTEHEAGLLVRSLLTAGVDTTVHGIGNALVCLARHPAEWNLLHQRPALARQAFEEALRFESPVQTFFRTTTRAVEIGGTAIAADSKVLLLLAAANRDPRRWPDPDRFSVARSPAGHVAFGTGIHGCLGQMLARLEGEALFEALATRVARIELLDEPTPLLNNTLRGWSRLPVRLHPA